VVKVSLWCRRIIQWQSACTSTNQFACIQPRHGRKQNDWLAYWDHVKLPRSRPLTQPTGACRRAQASSRKARAKDGRPGFVQSPKAGSKDVRAGPARPVSNTEISSFLSVYLPTPTLLYILFLVCVLLTLHQMAFGPVWKSPVGAVAATVVTTYPR